MLNVALFDKTAKEWREENKDLKGNMRDYASLNELLVLANIESYNAILIEKGLEQKERMIELRKLARNQMLPLEKLNKGNLKQLEDKKKIVDINILGLIKIGKTGNDQFENRMRFLENNGYANITGLKREFAIEVNGKAIVKDGVFTVLKGSFCGNTSKGYIPSIRRNAKIKDNILQEDIVCMNPTSAGWIVIGKPNNGWAEWKNLQGNLIKKYRDKEE